MSYVNSSRQRGATLFVGLMFLLVLTLVALITMQGTTLELKMATNQAQRQSAFQLSESMRLMTGAIVQQNQRQRGMQNFIGSAASWANLSGSGTVGGQPGGGATCAASTLPAAMELYQAETTSSYSTTWHTIDGVFRGNVPTANPADIAGNPGKIFSDCTSSSAGGAAWANVFAIGTRLESGTGTAYSEAQPGSGPSGGGAAKWFEIRSHGQITNGAAVVTAAEVRQSIDN
jgi:Tfp pilus assembly protein PilX